MRVVLALTFIAGLMFNPVFSAGEMITLHDSNISCKLDDKTGSLVSMGDLITSCVDRYIWFDKKKENRSSEKFDRVVKTTKTEDGKSITFVCKNKLAGLTITKIYTLQEKPERLLKKIIFQGQKGFVRYEAEVNVNKAFRDGSYYHRFIYHSAEVPRIDCREVRKEIKNLSKPGIVMVNRKENRTVAAYFYATNDQPAYPGEAGRGLWAFTPTGWRMVMNIAVDEKAQNSFTLGYELRKGTEFDYHLDMANRPEILAMRGDEPPAWANEIAWEASWDAGTVEDATQWKELADRLPWGYGLWTNWGWFAPYYGDYASNKEDAAPGTKDPAEFAAMFKRIGESSPKLKVGAYVLPSMISASSMAAKEHPEWMVYGRDCKPIRCGYADYARNDPTHLWAVDAPGVLEHWRSKIDGIMKNMNVDYIYTDGGVGGGGNLTNFKTLTAPQHYQWRELWKKSFQDVIHKNGGYYMSNYPVGVHSDGGYHECPWYPIYCADWKIMTDRLMYSRIYQRPGANLSTAGFVWSGAADHPATRTQLNFWFVHGLTPCFLENKGKDQIRAMNVAFPYIVAAYQLRYRELVQAQVSPAWEEEENEVEVHAQKIHGGGLLSVLNHIGEEETYEIEADSAPMGLKRSQPLYVWQHSMRAPNNQGKLLTGPAHLKKCFDTKFLEFLPKTPKRLKLSVTCPNELAQLIVATSSPALVSEVSGQACPIPLPNTLGVETSGIVDDKDGQVIVSVRTKVPGELLVVLPDGWDGQVKGLIRPASGKNAAAMGNRELPVKVENLFGRRMAKFAFPAEDSDIVLLKDASK